MIELRTITRDDWETCIDLKVARHQAHFVASNLYSLAQSRFLPGFRAVGIPTAGAWSASPSTAPTPTTATTGSTA